jgi:hypothetical protein
MSAPEPIEIEGARCSIWRVGPSLVGLRTASLGAFSCETPDKGADVLRLAMAKMKAEGFEAVLGPMDGSTWGKHRLVIESDGRAPFPMEPANPEHYPAAFDQAGMQIVSRYLSSERPADVPSSESRPPPGLKLRNIDLSNAEAELTRLHAVSLEAFSQNAFYVPIPLTPFLASYQPVLGMLDPDLVLLAEDEQGDLKGFLFAMPNVAEGPTTKTVILKTYASQVKGGGSMLANAFHQRVHDKGYTSVIHALMHESNLSAQHSANTGGKVFRRYALWGAKL